MRKAQCQRALRLPGVAGNAPSKSHRPGRRRITETTGNSKIFVPPQATEGCPKPKGRCSTRFARAPGPGRITDRSGLTGHAPSYHAVGMPPPRLLLITEAPVLPDAHGASQTLHALFATYPGALRIVSPTAPATDELDRVQLYRRLIPERLNHLGPRVARFRRRADLWLIRSTPRLRSAVRDFAPDVILVCPLGDWGAAVALRAQQMSGVPVLVYLMDDWPEHSPDPRVERLLREAAGWLMISEDLKDAVVRRSGLVPPPTVVTHNPARAASTARRDRAAGHQGTERIVYAGSIWPMHFDAVELTVRAVAGLRAGGRDIELVIHTSPPFWEAHADRWEPLGVVNGGFVTQDELRERLLEADLALLACAFASDQRHISRSSVQTKLTEYMAAGTPILGVGPADAASIRFVKRWGVGRWCTVSDADKLAATIRATLTDPGLAALSRHARSVVREHFDPDAVRATVHAFVASAAKR